METTVTRSGEDEEDAVFREEHEEDRAREDAVDEWNPDFHWLTEHVAVGACFPMSHAARLAGEHGISAVVDLREEDCDDEAKLSAVGIALLHLPTPDMEPASPEMLDRGVEFVMQRVRCGEKVLIHCQHGIGRSALLALCVLVDRGWAPLEALRHAKGRREILSPSRAQYEGWAAWLRERGIAAPDYYSFGCIAYRHLAGR
jgi:hypothetical protein